VDHELAGQSTYGKAHVLKARVMESPVAAIDPGIGRAADAPAGQTMRTEIARSTARLTVRGARDARMKWGLGT